MKLWIKNRAFIGIFLAIITSILLSLIVVKTTVDTINSSYKKNSLAMNSEISFQIPSPSKTQIKDLEKSGVISEAFAYYFTETKAVIGKKSYDISLLMSDTMKNIDFTMYSKSRLIESDASGNNTDYAYIDYSFASRTGLKIGDKITVNLAGKTFELTVSRIYEDNSVFDKTPILCEYSGIQKKIYEEAVNHISYSGAFVKCDDFSKAQSAFQNYIPEGKLRARNEFDSDSAFNSYNNSIKTSNYAKEIISYDSTFIKDEYNSEKNGACSKFIMGLLIFIIVIFIENLILFYRKKEKDLFTDLRNRKVIKNYRILSYIVELAVSITVIWSLLKVLSIFVDKYLPYIYISLGFYTSIAASFLGYTISFIICSRKDKKLEQKRKEQKKSEDEKFTNELLKNLYSYIPELKNLGTDDKTKDYILRFVYSKIDSLEKSNINDLNREIQKNIISKLQEVRKRICNLKEFHISKDSFNKILFASLKYSDNKNAENKIILQKLLNDYGLDVDEINQIIKLC